MGAALNFSQELVLAAIKGSHAIMSTIATRLGCQWYSAQKYCAKWAVTRQALIDEGETILDTAESKLYESIQAGNTQDAKWLLATKGKHRGFSERHEMTGPDGGPLRGIIIVRSECEAKE